jgi:predicted transcriptional regulator
VLLDLSEYERLVERAEFQEAIEAGLKAAGRGDLHDHEEAEAIFDSFGRSDE